MVLFPEEQKDYVTQELENVKADVMGSITMTLSEDQAKFLMKNNKIKDIPDEDAHQLMIELSSKWILDVSISIYKYFALVLEL